jgi:hypothetical protein
MEEKPRTKEYYAEYYQNNKKEHDERIKSYKTSNPEKGKQYVKKWQEKNKDYVKEQNRLNKNKQNKKKRDFVNEYKKTCSCKKCNESRWYVLDFHHVNPVEKSFELGNASKHSIEKIQNEIKKCITLCRNCHSEFHYLEKENGITLMGYIK